MDAGSVGLVGRAAERARVERLLADAEVSRGGAIAVVGEPGVGKTALLGHAHTHANGRIGVLSSIGAEAEAELPFAGLLGLLSPLLHLLDGLPSIQRRALSGALALGPAVPAGRLAVDTATLGLLSAAAEDGGLLLLVDDAHWLDAASADTLTFVARRIEQESIAIIFAQRPADGRPLDLAGIERIPLAGLGRDDAAVLLSRTAGAELPADVVARLHAATGGNPLALLETPTSVPARELDGRDPLRDPLPVGRGVQEAFRLRLERLPERTRLATLLLAAAGAEPCETISRAAATLGLGMEDLEPAEQERLLEVGPVEARFRHPLVRAAAYEGASAPDRRSVHRALSAVTSGARRAGHLWAAAVGADQEAAEALEAAAREARARTGYGAAALAMERAAHLTPAGEARNTRLALAAHDRLTAGDVPRAVEHATEALEQTREPLLVAELTGLLGAVDLLAGSLDDGFERLRSAGEQMADADPERAAWTLAYAALPCVMRGRTELAYLTAKRAYELAVQVGGRIEAIASVLMGGSLILSGRDHGDGLRALLDRWEDALDERVLIPGAPHAIGLLQYLAWVERYDDANRAADRIAAMADEAGATGVLPLLLAGRVESDFRRGDWVSARARIAASLRIGEQAGQPLQAALPLGLRAHIEAAMGQEAACRASVQRCLDVSVPAGLRPVYVYGASALGLLELGLGRFEPAVAHLREAARRCHEYGQRDPSVVPFGPNLVEALARAGRRDEADEALDAFAAQAERTRRPWALATAARCRGILSGADDCFARAYEAHGVHASPFEIGRTELCHGESLRRARRAREARERLSSALERFERIGAVPWAARARAELRAAGGTEPPRHEPALGNLTPQELEVAMLVAGGATNREAAAALFVSPKTVELHLTRVFRKLGLRSRTELATLVTRSEAALTRQD